jgi:hypothetical protein
MHCFLVVLNHIFRSNERKVSLDQVHSTLFDINQERIKEKEATKPNLIRYIECSMLTGNGLRYIYNYLGIPFVQLQVCSSNNSLFSSHQVLKDVLKLD